jgi:integrase/recombinase XerD
VEDLTLLEHYYSRLLALERLSLLTAETYGFEIRRFLDWLSSEGLDSKTIDSPGVARYLEFRREKNGIDSRSAAKAISALRSFFRYIGDEGVRLDNPASILESPKRKGYLPEVLSQDRVEGILEETDSDDPKGLRDRTIVELIYSAGLRVSEVVALNMRDIFFPEGIARVRGQGEKSGWFLSATKPLFGLSIIWISPDQIWPVPEEARLCS